MTISTPNRSKSLGMAIPPVELTASTTTRNFFFWIASGVTKGRASTSSIWRSIYRSSWVSLPKWSTVAKEKSFSWAILKIAFPSWSETNSPLSLRSFRAFHSLGLWLAVRIIPPLAFSKGTATSTVGVVLSPILITSIPKPISVYCTKFWIISPEMRASRPMTTLTCSLLLCPLSQEP